MLLGNVRQQAHLLVVEHHAGGVAGVGHQNSPGVGIDERLNLLPGGIAVSLFRIRGNGPDGGTGDLHEGGVIGIEGLRDQDLVPVLQDAGHDDLQRLAAAVGGHDIVAGDGEAQIGIVIPHCLQIALHAGGRSILQNSLSEVAHRIKKRLGRLDIRLTDVQVMNLAALGLRRQHIGMEFPDGRELAGLDLTGKFHGNDLLGPDFSRLAGETCLIWIKKSPLTTVRGENTSTVPP